jgi:hypothetical protein
MHATARTHARGVSRHSRVTTLTSRRLSTPEDTTQLGSKWLLDFDHFDRLLSSTWSARLLVSCATRIDTLRCRARVGLFDPASDSMSPRGFRPFCPEPRLVRSTRSRPVLRYPGSDLVEPSRSLASLAPIGSSDPPLANFRHTLPEVCSRLDTSAPHFEVSRASHVQLEPLRWTRTRRRVDCAHAV